ncbi:histidine phosphatase family protein [Nostoc sp. FACHB-888]|uniref:histidine phosphatase family protein n=1 Tax=Nostoc sp. FACHB-888 TaxID=2692842 RepID=UPI001F551111|nr:histidine phosphatase family protein [Nostoc sp. FACHB-888]
MTYAYRMDDAVQVANQAATDIEAWLWSKSETRSVINVENDPDYQRRDIDLIWTTHSSEILIEIKGDRWNKTRNLFFETHSNLEKGTPGCFLYTEADWLFYYFVNTRQLYRLPMPKTREWFHITMKRFLKG